MSVAAPVVAAPTSCAHTERARTGQAADSAAAMRPLSAMVGGAIPAQLPDGRAYWVIPPTDGDLLNAVRDLALLAPDLQK